MRPDQLIVALDVENLEKARKVVSALGDSVCFYKVGLRLFTREGPRVVQWLKKRGYKVFLDLKLHDIPNTVAQAVEAATFWGVDFLTLHASGGEEMIAAAARSARVSARRFKKPRPKIFAVSILTSLKKLSPLGIKGNLSGQVLRLAGLAKKAGVDGIVCSPHEIRLIRKRIGQSLKILTPGIRLGGEGSDDQKRIATPQQALRDGADYLVIGRPILKASRPKKLVQTILSSI